MTTPEPEVKMTVEEVVRFVRSPYFTAAFRVAMLVFGFAATLVGGAVTYAVYDTRAKAESAVDVSSDVQEKLQVRIKDNETFQANLTSKVEDVAKDVDFIRHDQLGVAQAVGRIEGVLEQLQQRVGVASWQNRAEN